MKGKTSIVVAMIIFGSVGIFVRNINLSSMEIALMRAIIGSLFLITVGLVLRRKISIKDIKANALLLILSGMSMGINWIALFQGYKYTTVSNATLGYNLAAIFVILLSPIILKEKLTPAKVVCAFIAMFGLFLVIKAGGNGNSGTYNHVLGMAYSILGAVFYATVILINKHIKNLPGFETTLLQLTVAALVLLPVVLLQSGPNIFSMGTKSWVNLIILALVHTGLAYLLYFGSMKELNAQSIAIFSYIDPVSAVVMSVIFLGENITLLKVVGGILILGSTYFAENKRIKRPI